MAWGAPGGLKKGFFWTKNKPLGEVGNSPSRAHLKYALIVKNGFKIHIACYGPRPNVYTRVRTGYHVNITGANFYLVILLCKESPSVLF